MYVILYVDSYVFPFVLFFVLYAYDAIQLRENRIIAGFKIDCLLGYSSSSFPFFQRNYFVLYLLLFCAWTL